MVKTVIIGGGIAGLSAATLLIEHPNMEIEIYEKEERLGGQAASMYNTNCNVEHCWRIFGPTYHNIWYIFKNVLNIMHHFTPFIQNCLIDNEKITNADPVLTAVFPNIMRDVPINKYYKYFDFFMLSSERVVTSYDTVNALDYFNNNEVKTLLGPYQGLEASKLSISSACKNLYQMMDPKKYDFLPKVTQITNKPTNDAIFTPWEKYLLNKNIKIHKNHALEDICIEKNKIKYVVLNSKKIYADEFIFACSLKPLNHILEKYTCETFKQMKELEENLQLFFSINLYFNKKLDMSCHNFLLTDEPWKPTVQRKVNWSDEIIRNCSYENKEIKEIWNVAFLDYTHGNKHKKILRDCTLEEAIEEGLFQIKQNRFILKTMEENHVTYDDVYLGHDVWYQNKNSSETFPLSVSNHGTPLLKIADLNPKFSPNQGTMKYIPETHPKDIPENMSLCGYYTHNTYGGASMEASCETGLIAADYLLQKHKIPNQTMLPIKHMNKYLTRFPLFKPLIKLDEILYENKLDPITKYVNSFYLFLFLVFVCIVILVFVLYKCITLYYKHTSSESKSKSSPLSILKKSKLSRSFKRLKR